MKVYINTSTWDKRKERAKAAGLDAEGASYGEDEPMLFVKIGEQKVCAFPKFGTWGIGFWRESNCNTNLPFTCPAEQIRDHIEHAGLQPVDPGMLLESIQTLQQAIPFVCSEFNIPMPHDPRLETLRRYPGLKGLKV